MSRTRCSNGSEAVLGHAPCSLLVVMSSLQGEILSNARLREVFMGAKKAKVPSRDGRMCIVIFEWIVCCCKFQLGGVVCVCVMWQRPSIGCAARRWFKRMEERREIQGCSGFSQGGTVVRAGGISAGKVRNKVVERQKDSVFCCWFLWKFYESYGWHGVCF